MLTDDEVPITDLQYAEYMELDELQLLVENANADPSEERLKLAKATEPELAAAKRFQVGLLSITVILIRNSHLRHKSRD
jgi:hypothetical protein